MTAVTAVTRAEDVRLAADQQQLRGQRHGQGERCGSLEQTASFSEFHRNTLHNYTHQIGQYGAYGACNQEMNMMLLGTLEIFIVCDRLMTCNTHLRMVKQFWLWNGLKPPSTTI